MIAQHSPLTVYTQDNPQFPANVVALHDKDLDVSWFYNIETVPTVLRIENGKEIARTIGWSQDQWRAITGISSLGEELPVMRPGCGSMSVDPDLQDELRVRFNGDVLKSRHIPLADAEDEFEALFARGWTDGLPVIPPTPERVLRMLSGTTRDPHEVIAIAPPDLVELTIEKVAVNAVMAGCMPEYLPWVIAALEAVCTDEFNMHGVLATTMPVGPVIVCHGPGTRRIGMNSGINTFGQGNRANSTIGRAVQLTIRNVGGGRPGDVDRATHGNPGKLSFCFAEDEENSPFGTLGQERGLGPDEDGVTVFAGEGPRVMVDQLARTPEQLLNSLAACMRTAIHPKLVIAFDAIVTISPDHARIFADEGWTRERILEQLHARLQLPGTDIVRGAHGIAEGVSEAFADATLPKFRPNGILLTYAGGGAGLFSSVIAGWVNGQTGSDPVTRAVGV